GQGDGGDLPPDRRHHSPRRGTRQRAWWATRSPQLLSPAAERRQGAPVGQPSHARLPLLPWQERPMQLLQRRRLDHQVRLDASAREQREGQVMRTLRDYQLQAIDGGDNFPGILRALDQHKSTLLVMATGLGKTVIMSQVANDWK